MPEPKWRPASEAEATATPAVFREWLLSMRGVALARPAALAAWRRDEPEQFADAIAAFAGLPPVIDDVRRALLRGHDSRLALIDGDRRRTRADLLAAPILPAPLETLLAALTPKNLPALAASHLLDRDTRPDDHVPCARDATDPWPLGAWIVGAAIVLRPPA